MSTPAKQKSQHGSLFKDSLPFEDVLWESQGEIPAAVPLAMRYGRMKAKQAHVWIYLCENTPNLIFHSYFDDGRAGNYMIIDEVLIHAIPDIAFVLATSPMELLALATYYFIRKQFTIKYDLNLTHQLESHLVTICQNRHTGQIHGSSTRVVVLKLPPAKLLTIHKSKNKPALLQRAHQAQETKREQFSDEEALVGCSLSIATVRILFKWRMYPVQADRL